MLSILCFIFALSASLLGVAAALKSIRCSRPILASWNIAFYGVGAFTLIGFGLLFQNAPDVFSSLPLRFRLYLLLIAGFLSIGDGAWELLVEIRRAQRARAHPRVHHRHRHILS